MSEIRRLRHRYTTDRVVADVREFDAVEDSLRATLPADYKSFLMVLGSGNTMESLTYYRFYALEELRERQDTVPQRVLEFATDDSSGYAFDFGLRAASGALPVVSYPLSSSERSEIEPVADSFRDFLIHILRRLEPLDPL